MIALALFVAICVAGVGYLFWYLTASDQVTADKLRSGEISPIVPQVSSDDPDQKADT